MTYSQFETRLWFWNNVLKRLGRENGVILMGSLSCFTFENAFGRYIFVLSVLSKAQELVKIDILSYILTLSLMAATRY